MISTILAFLKGFPAFFNNIMELVRMFKKKPIEKELESDKKAIDDRRHFEDTGRPK